jgi:hypothetical protein
VNSWLTGRPRNAPKQKLGRSISMSSAEPYRGTVKNGNLLVELAAREAGRRKHKNWKRVSALDLVDVLTELGFKIVVAR